MCDGGTNSCAAKCAGVRSVRFECPTHSRVESTQRMHDVEDVVRWCNVARRLRRYRPHSCTIPWLQVVQTHRRAEARLTQESDAEHTWDKKDRAPPDSHQGIMLAYRRVYPTTFNTNVLSFRFQVALNAQYGVTRHIG